MSYPHSRQALRIASIAVTASLLGRLWHRWSVQRRMSELWTGACPYCGYTLPYYGREATLHRVWWVDASLGVMTWRCDHCEELNKGRLDDDAWEWLWRRGATRGVDVDRAEMSNAISFDELHDFITNGGLDKLESAFDTQISGDGERDREGFGTSATNRTNQKGSGEACSPPAGRRAIDEPSRFER